MIDRILESRPLTRIFSFFIVNPDRAFSMHELQKCMGGRNLLPNLNILVRMNAIQSFNKRGVKFLKLNKRYQVSQELKAKALKSARKYKDELVKTISRMQGLKAVILTGIFMGNTKFECDLVLVGRPSGRAIQSIIKAAEKAAGQEVNYAIFSDKEFDYRRHIFDRFMKDVFENDHFYVINKIK